MTPFWSNPDGTATIYHGDCRKVVDRIATNIDAVVTDPPYGINATDMTLGTGKREFVRGEWDQKRPDIKPLLKLAPFLVVWGGNYFSDVLPPTNDWLIWHKKNDGLSFSECEMAWSNIGKQTRLISHHWSGENKTAPNTKTDRSNVLVYWTAAGFGGNCPRPVHGEWNYRGGLCSSWG